MRWFYLVPGMAIGLLALLATGLFLFVSKAGTESQYSFLPQAQVLAPRAIEGTPPPTACSYSVLQTTGSIVPGTTDIGNHCDECITELQLPFPVTYYGQQFSQANVSSNGNLQFISANPISFNECLPGPSFEAAIMPHWDDLLTDDNPGCPGGGCGIFTSLSGSAPNRIFTIEWRAVLYRDPFQPVNFQVWFYEDQTRFDFVYGVVSENGSDSTVGVQYDKTTYTQFSCMTPSLSQNLALHWEAQGCSAVTPTNTPTPCPGCTPTRTATITQTPTPIPTATPMPCGFERFTGSIVNNDLTQVGRLIRDEVRSLCDAPETCPGIEDTALRHYDSYTRTNNTSSTQCVTVGLSTLCQGTQFIFAAAYLDSFDPNNICENYLADMGVSPYPHAYMSFELPAGRSAVIVVSEVTTNQGCPEYTMTITGLGSCNTPTPTVTGTPPTATATPTVISCEYSFATATATIVPGTEDTGNHCDDCVTNVSLPFPFLLYGQEYDAITVSSNGNIQFATTSSNRINTCLPAPSLSASLLPNWTDLVTDCVDCGIFTSLSGSAPNRIFNIEWRAGYFKGGTANFEARLHEGTGVFDFIYGHMDDPGNNSTVGVQNAGAVSFTQYNCNSGGLVSGLLVRGIPQVCATATSTPSPTSTASATSTVCTTSFTDVPEDHPFYTWIRCLACRNIISGYTDGTFRPGNDITRGQIAKLVSNAAGFEDEIPPDRRTFEDVPPDHPFRLWIERLVLHSVIGGYPCGADVEPCNPPVNRPYFRPFANATRGQLSKIASNAAGIGGSPTGLFYTDVPEDHPFYIWIVRLANLGVISGYPCGGPGEPCDDANRPYFRPFANVTRGQASKIVANTFFPGCQTTDRK